MNSGRIVLAIDPGLDRTGAAIVSLGAGERHPVVLDTFRCLTKPEAPIHTRLWLLLTQAQAWSGQLAIRALSDRAEPTIAVEVPEKAFTFQQHRGGARSERMSAKPLSLFWQALGAIRAGVAGQGVPIVSVSSTTTQKEQRHALFSRYLEKARNEDERDAIVLGCRVVLGDIRAGGGAWE